MKVISRTMNQGQNYGPQIIVKRLSSNGTSMCIFEQVAKQIVNVNAELLRLPSRAWKVITFKVIFFTIKVLSFHGKLKKSFTFVLFRNI